MVIPAGDTASFTLESDNGTAATRDWFVQKWSEMGGVWGKEARVKRVLFFFGFICSLFLFCPSCDPPGDDGIPADYFQVRFTTLNRIT